MGNDAARVDVEIWLIAFVGNAVSWPRKYSIGGLPARVGVRIWKFCDSSHQFLESASLPANGTDDADRKRAVYLSNETHKAVQDAVSDLVAAGFVGHDRLAVKSPAAPA